VTQLITRQMPFLSPTTPKYWRTKRQSDNKDNRM